VQRHVYDGFSLRLPEGWSDIVDEISFTDPDEFPPLRFNAAGGPGALFVSTPLFPRDKQPGARAADVEELARSWGRRRGLDAPLTCASAPRRDGAMATATYRLGGEFVQLWFLSNGSAVVHASYVCPWTLRDAEQRAREEIAASLRFA